MKVPVYPAAPLRRVVTMVLVLATACAAQSYTYSPLAIPSGGTFLNVFAMNNKGQVLGETGTTVAPNRYPAVWTNGAAQRLTIPATYIYLAQPGYYAINDSGTVVGTVADTSPVYNGRILLWTSGNAANPALLPDAPPPSGCSGTPSSISYGLNSAGNVSGTTRYPRPAPNGCTLYWVYANGAFRILPFPIPSVCLNLPPPNQPGVSFASPMLNDADQVVELMQNFFCGAPYLPPQYTGPPAMEPVLIQPSGAVSYLPSGFGNGAWSPTQINNLSQVLGFVDYGGAGPNHTAIWSAGVTYDLGPGGYAHVNNVGQVLYYNTLGIVSPYFVWQNGVSTAIQLPAIPFYGSPPPVAFNDAGQIATQSGALAYVFTPSGPCGQDVSSEVLVTRGGFRFNRATQHFTQLITITNASASPIPGPISLVLDSVPSSATLYGVSGATSCTSPQGSPYLNAAAASLGAGVSTSVTLDFIDTSQSGITYATRVIAGPGGR